RPPLDYAGSMVGEAQVVQVDGRRLRVTNLDKVVLITPVDTSPTRHDHPLTTLAPWWERRRSYRSTADDCA
ncbi:hypothetical protein CTI14_69120, partial [Methylobacterium radiotolerans]